MHAEALDVREVIPDHVYTIADLFSLEDCQRWIAFAERGSGFPVVGPVVAPPRGHAFRNNARLAFQDPAFAQMLWERSGLARLLAPWRLAGRRVVRGDRPTAPGPRPVGLNGNLRLYRYEPGQRFDAHYDDWVLDSLGRRSEFTLLIYLNDLGTDPSGVAGPSRPGDPGGETVFYPDRGTAVAVSPRAGLALLHRHGAHCLRHEGREVHRGVKYVLRSDVVYA
ncbi:hypothetical protein IWQ60_007773 [Tieghemiomyces parasiticus]|uniref:Fe2OG dioxygenase domain-containing protein n=1 Tax=Tieghemiomyces parasiticus TaxID=78921 RepID=A0A9W7ZWA2_9FUNG|nr:hypothetical protein IWQ60_007773 [Tieghemiomyces parasiticus]